MPEAPHASELQLTSQIKFLQSQLKPNPSQGASRPLGPKRTDSDMAAIKSKIDALQKQLETLVKSKN